MIRSLGLNFNIAAKVIFVLVAIILVIILGFSFYVYILNVNINKTNDRLDMCNSKVERIKAESKVENYELIKHIEQIESSYARLMSKNAAENAKSNIKAKTSFKNGIDKNKRVIKKAADEKNFNAIWARIDELL